jgi:hypothetical protein
MSRTQGPSSPRTWSTETHPLHLAALPPLRQTAEYPRNRLLQRHHVRYLVSQDDADRDVQKAEQPLMVCQISDGQATGGLLVRRALGVPCGGVFVVYYISGYKAIYTARRVCAWIERNSI